MAYVDAANLEGCAMWRLWVLQPDAFAGVPGVNCLVLAQEKEVYSGVRLSHVVSFTSLYMSLGKIGCSQLEDL